MIRSSNPGSRCVRDVDCSGLQVRRRINRSNEGLNPMLTASPPISRSVHVRIQSPITGSVAPQPNEPMLSHSTFADGSRIAAGAQNSVGAMSNGSGSCPVWLRPMGVSATKIKVAGQSRVQWLRDQLQNRGVVCTEPSPLAGTPYFTFHILHAHRITDAKLRQILEAIPEVELMLDPA